MDNDYLKITQFIQRTILWIFAIPQRTQFIEE